MAMGVPCKGNQPGLVNETGARHDSSKIASVNVIRLRIDITTLECDDWAELGYRFTRMTAHRARPRQDLLQAELADREDYTGINCGTSKRTAQPIRSDFWSQTFISVRMTVA